MPEVVQKRCTGGDTGGHTGGHTVDPKSPGLNSGRVQIPGANGSGEGGAEEVSAESTQNRGKPDSLWVRKDL